MAGRDTLIVPTTQFDSVYNHGVFGTQATFGDIATRNNKNIHEVKRIILAVFFTDENLTLNHFSPNQLRKSNIVGHFILIAMDAESAEILCFDHSRTALSERAWIKLIPWARRTFDNLYQHEAACIEVQGQEQYANDCAILLFANAETFLHNRQVSKLRKK